MTGSLQIKNNKYYIVINYYDENNKRKLKWIKTDLPVKNNKRKAEELLKETLVKYNDCKINYSDISFIDFMDNWFESKKDSLRPCTYERYYGQFKKHIKPFFKNISLQELSPVHIQNYYNKKIKEGLSGNTVLKHHANINNCLKYALSLNLIPYNPASRVMLPKKEKYYASYYDEDMIKTLLKCIKGDDLEDLIYMTALYGLRRSEVLGLKWDAIDFKNKTIQIYHTAIRTQQGMVYADTTKTQSSRRTLPLNEKIEVRLLELQKKQLFDKLLFGSSYNDNNYIFKKRDGTPFDSSFVSHHFNLILQKNNLPHIRFHDLRHSAASMFFELGFSLKEVQEYLGHSNISTTADIYTHMQYKSKVKMADTIGSKLVI